jgi:hypothetical protein
MNTPERPETFERLTTSSDRASSLYSGDSLADHRARLALEESNARERRRIAAAEQVAESSGPDQRIRVWERVHALTLPVNPEHPLIRVIAAGTNLSVADVRGEQRRRARESAVSTPAS